MNVDQKTQNDSGAGALLSSDIPSNRLLPEFLRLPKNGQRCPVTGLCRATMNELILPTKGNEYRPPVKSVSLRKRGAVRGVRLIPTDDLIRYLRENMIN